MLALLRALQGCGQSCWLAALVANCDAGRSAGCDGATGEAAVLPQTLVSADERPLRGNLPAAAVSRDRRLGSGDQAIGLQRWPKTSPSQPADWPRLV